MRWNEDYKDLLAPYYDILKDLVNGERQPSRQEEEDFLSVAKGIKEAYRPLQKAWVALHSLSEENRQIIIASFGNDDQAVKLKRSKQAFSKLENQGIFSSPDDIKEEIHDQNIAPPTEERKVFEPLGRREDWIREIQKNKYNSS